MVKEIDVIPVKAKPKSRAGQIREDIKDAFTRKINKFEFVGDVYNTCKDYSPQVREEASRFFYRYLENEVIEKTQIKNAGYVHNTYERAFSVFRQTDNKGIVHVHMEIHYDEFEAIIRDWANVLQKGHR